MPAINITWDDLTLGEIEELEEISGVSFAEVQEKVTAKVMTALVYIARRREDPGYTLADARNERVGEVQFGNPTPPPEDNEGRG